MNMSGPNMGPGGPGRGGYPQAGRGRGYSPYPSHQQIPYQQNSGYRGPPSQGRGGPPFPGQSSPMPPFANPQHRSGRSPHLQHSVPGTPQMGQSPMPNQAPMQPNQFGGYPPQMGPNQVNYKSHFSKRSRTSPKLSSRRRGDVQQPLRPIFFAMGQAPPMSPADLLDPRGDFLERYLIARDMQAQYGMQYGMQPDPHYPPYQHAAYQMYPGMQYIAPGQAPGSPRSPYPQQAAAQPQYYGHQPAQSMSRTPSGVSDPRPPSALGQSHTPSSTPGPNHAQRPSQTSNSPAPIPSQFKIPQKRGAGIVIKDPNSGAVKTFDKAPASPAPSSKSPAVASTPTPPPPKSEDTLHIRTESKSHKSTEEVQNSLKEQIAKKIEAEKLESQRLKDEAEEKETRERDAAEKAKKEAEEAKAREQEAVERAANEKAQKEKQERVEKEEAEQAEKEAQAQAKAAAEAEAQRKASEEATAGAVSEKKLDEEEITKDKSEKEAPSTPSGVAAGIAKMSLESGASTPASDDSMGPPSRAASANKREKPVPLDLQINTKAVEPPQPTPAMISLGSARFIDRIRDITYPAAIASPNPSLNTTNPKGRFKYDKEFLVQFQRVFKEKPVVEWDSRLKDTVGDPDSARTPSARTPQTSTRGSSTRGANLMGAFPMGSIGQSTSGRTLPPGTTSEQRASLAGVTGMASGRPAMNTPLSSFSRPPGQFPVGGPSPLSRNGSTTNLGPQGNMATASRSNNRSQRGQNSKRGMDKSNSKAEEQSAKAMPLTAHVEITPLKPSSGGWKPRSLAAASSATGMAGPAPGASGSSTHMAPDMVQRKVKANLNKMTPEKFEKIADQILEIAAQSKDETDGRTLRQVIQLTFEKATDEAHWASMYAKFCKRMLESMNPDIKDEGILDKNGNIVTGGNLFRKYLLNRCQEEFERGWKMNLPEKPEGESEEAVMLSDEYYIMAAAKRRGLGLVKFIGELYKLNMLTERIMHMCLKKLVDYEGVPDEAEVESLSSLLKTIGRNLDDTDKGKQMMDVYFTRINQMRETPALPSRLSFMLLDIMDLRRKGWDSKEDDKGPKTIQKIHEEVRYSTSSHLYEILTSIRPIKHSLTRTQKKLDKTVSAVVEAVCPWAVGTLDSFQVEAINMACSHHQTSTSILLPQTIFEN
jgi:translation initiation factor 4G